VVSILNVTPSVFLYSSVDSAAVVLVCSCPKISGSPVMGWLDAGRQVSSPLQPDLPRSRSHPVLLQVPSLVGYCAFRPPSAGVSVSSISSPGTFAMSLGVAPCSSRTLPRDAHTVLLLCHNLRLYIRACSLRGCLHIQSTWGLQCTGRSGLGHSSTCTYRLLLVPKISLPHGICLQRTVPLLKSHPQPSCSSRSRLVSTS
jgi:hypothetical protein